MNTVKAVAAVDSLTIKVTVMEPVVVEELTRHTEGIKREQFALSALSIGIRSLKFASGQLDVVGIRDAGNELIQQLRERLATESTQMTKDVSDVLRRYFDPQTGLMPERIKSLVQKDGELERVLKAHVGDSNSVLADSLTKHIGETSPLLKVLSPSDENGLRMQIRKTVESALLEQKEVILKEFSFDNKNSALSRFRDGVVAQHQGFTQDLEKNVAVLFGEFCLEKPDSALSMFLQRVESGQNRISEQFSMDNEESMLNKLSRRIEKTSEKIDQSLTLDDEASPLSRLKREIDNLVEANARFHADCKEFFATQKAQKLESERSTRHGITFEADVGAFVQKEAQDLGDIWEYVGATPGSQGRSKKGDFITSLSADSAAPGARIVWEAKEDKSFTLRRALVELDEARKNREAQVGIFVFSKKASPEGLVPLKRYGSNLIVIWDPEDPLTDLFVKAAYSLAQSLLVKEAKGCEENKEVLKDIETATRCIEKQIENLVQIQTWAQTVRTNGDKISTMTDDIQKDLSNEVQRLDRQIQHLKIRPAE